jgi:hypothetical protein
MLAIYPVVGCIDEIVRAERPLRGGEALRKRATDSAAIEGRAQAAESLLDTARNPAILSNYKQESTARFAG